MSIPYPIEKFIYKDEIYDVPCDAYTLEDGESTVRYLRADLVDALIEAGNVLRVEAIVYYGLQSSTVGSQAWDAALKAIKE